MRATLIRAASRTAFWIAVGVPLGAGLTTPQSVAQFEPAAHRETIAIPNVPLPVPRPSFLDRRAAAQPRSAFAVRRFS